MTHGFKLWYSVRKDDTKSQFFYELQNYKSRILRWWSWTQKTNATEWLYNTACHAQSNNVVILKNTKKNTNRVRNYTHVRCLYTQTHALVNSARVRSASNIQDKQPRYAAPCNFMIASFVCRNLLIMTSDRWLLKLIGVVWESEVCVAAC